MKDEEINIGDHVWAELGGKLLVALKSSRGYYVCGGWEGVVKFNEFDTVISVINNPYKTELYYN